MGESPSSQLQLTCVSIEAASLGQSPGRFVDRLRRIWITPGVFLLLEAVTVSVTEGSEKRTCEHCLLGFEPPDANEVFQLLSAQGLNNFVLWEPSHAVNTMERAAEFYWSPDAPDMAFRIYCLMADAFLDNYVVLSQAGRFFLGKESLRHAAPFVKAAYRIAPHVPEVTMNYCIYLLADQQYARAIPIVKKAKHDWPDHPAVAAIHNDLQQSGMLDQVMEEEVSPELRAYTEHLLGRPLTAEETAALSKKRQSSGNDGTTS